MRRMLAFIGGVLSGGAIGAAIAVLFAPVSGDSMRDSLNRWRANAAQAGQDAALRKRAELEARLVEMTGPHPSGSPLASAPDSGE
ncbi:MAG: YtxH domain-containing protein [Anaerolineae bacterium]|jgi:gas vesicle protein|nr:YtxH domain-containing protein [Anaerolineae bacterium]